MAGWERRQKEVVGEGRRGFGERWLPFVGSISLMKHFACAFLPRRFRTNLWLSLAFSFSWRLILLLLAVLACG